MSNSLVPPRVAVILTLIFFWAVAFAAPDRLAFAPDEQPNNNGRGQGLPEIGNADSVDGDASKNFGLYDYSDGLPPSDKPAELGEPKNEYGAAAAAVSCNPGDLQIIAGMGDLKENENSVAEKLMDVAVPVVSDREFTAAMQDMKENGNSVAEKLMDVAVRVVSESRNPDCQSASARVKSYPYINLPPNT